MYGSKLNVLIKNIKTMRSPYLKQETLINAHPKYGVHALEYRQESTKDAVRACA